MFISILLAHTREFPPHLSRLSMFIIWGGHELCVKRIKYLIRPKIADEATLFCHFSV